MTQYAPKEIEKAKNFIIGAHKYCAPKLAPGLYLVATPIGNLRDISLRGLEVLAAADIIACEDTRTSHILLNHYGIKAKTIPYHEHNTQTATASLLRALAEGKTVALISDAGTPLLSDPGFPLVQKAAAEGFTVSPIPGASALLAALTACGLSTHHFFFGGFLPPKQTARQKLLQQWQTLPATLVFYESPRRVGASLADMVTVFGPHRPACLCRELTKKFETFDRADLAELAAIYQKETPRGEIVLVISGNEEKAAPPSAEEIDILLLHLAQTLPPTHAATKAAKQTGMKKQDLYHRLLELKNKKRKI